MIRHTISFTTGLTEIQLAVKPGPDPDPSFTMTCSCGAFLDDDDELCVEKTASGASVNFVLVGAGFTTSPSAPPMITIGAAPSEQLLTLEVTRTTERGTTKKKVKLKVSTESNPGTDGGHGVLDKPGPGNPPEPPDQSGAPGERANERERKG
jgi:hypothetical protein